MHADSPRLERAIAAGKAGDRSALHYLYVRYADEVFAHLSDIVPRRSDAEDITQKVFLAMSHAIATYDPQELPFDRWLLRLADDSIRYQVAGATKSPRAVRAPTSSAPA